MGAVSEKEGDGVCRKAKTATTRQVLVAGGAGSPVGREPIHNQPLLFVGILLMIFGIQFILVGLQSEMIRHYAFQEGEEYSIRQELD